MDKIFYFVIHNQCKNVAIFSGRVSARWPQCLRYVCHNCWHIGEAAPAVGRECGLRGLFAPLYHCAQYRLLNSLQVSLKFIY